MAPSTEYDPSIHRYATRSKPLTVSLPPRAPSRAHDTGRRNRLIAGRISKDWPITRSSRRPRELTNPGTRCYLNSSLQILLHLPKFQNWVLQHADPANGQDWPCYDADPNRHLPGNQELDEVLLDMGDSVKQCVPCLLKALIKDYWGPVCPRNNGLPDRFPGDWPSVLAIQHMAVRWFCPLPGVRDWTQTEEENTMRRLQEETWEDQNLRVANACGQQDADQFMRRILDACQESIHPNNNARVDQYDSLFVLLRHVVRKCANCGHVRRTFPVNECKDLGFSEIRPSQNSETDTLDAALARSDALQTEVYDSITCDNCSLTGHVQDTKKILSGPEYLHVQLNLGVFNEIGMLLDNEKNKSPLAIPHILDLTEHVYVAPGASGEPLPLRYKLIGTIWHSGDTPNHGHYVAGVTEAPPKAEKGQRPTVAAPRSHWYINDLEAALRWKPKGANPLTLNPLTRNGEKFNSMMLMYERLPRETPIKDELVASLPVDFYSAPQRLVKKKTPAPTTARETNRVKKPASKTRKRNPRK